MKTVPGSNFSSGIFPGSTMATEQMSEVYQWLSEQLSEIGLEEFHVRSIVAYFFMNLQDLEDESSQDCGVSPTSNSNGRRQSGFEVISLQDRQKRCAELYIKNVSSKDNVPLAIVKKIVAELSLRLTTGTQESASSGSSQDQDSRSPDSSSDSPMDRYNKAFPPLSEDNSPTQFSPPDDRDNVWTQRRPLTSKLAGETSQKNGAVSRQPQAGTKRDTPSRRSKTGHGKENELTAGTCTKKKVHPSRRRDLIQHSNSARQLNYPTPRNPGAPVGLTSQEDEEKKTRIAEYLITALGIKSSGNSRHAQHNPSANTAFSQKPMMNQSQRKHEISSGSIPRDVTTQNLEACLPAHMFPEQHVSLEQSCTQQEKGVVNRDVASTQVHVPQLKQNDPEQESDRSAFPSSPVLDILDEQQGASASCARSYSQSSELSDRWPQTEVTITADQRHMFAAFSPKDESLASRDTYHRILPYEILERDVKKKEGNDEPCCYDYYPHAYATTDIPNQSSQHLNASCSHVDNGFQGMSTSLPHAFCTESNIRPDNKATSEVFAPSSVPANSKATLKESFSYPSLGSLAPATAHAQHQRKHQYFEDVCLFKSHSQPQSTSEPPGTADCCESKSPSGGQTEVDGSSVYTPASHPSQADLGQWIQYFQSLNSSSSDPGHTSQPYTPCEPYGSCLSGDARWQNSKNQNTSSSALCETGPSENAKVNSVFGDCEDGQNTKVTSSCSRQEMGSGYQSYAPLFDHWDPGDGFLFRDTQVPGFSSTMGLGSRGSDHLHYLGARGQEALPYHSEFGRSSERRGILCKAYSPLKVEGVDQQETELPGNGDIVGEEEQLSSVPQIDSCAECLGDDDVFAAPSQDFEQYSHSIWSNGDGALGDHPSLSLHHCQQQESSRHPQHKETHGWMRSEYSHRSHSSSEGSPSVQACQHPYTGTSKLSEDQRELGYGGPAYWTYKRQSPFSYGTDAHLFPSFHLSHYGSSDQYSSDWDRHNDAEPSAALPTNTASSSLLEAAGTMRGSEQGSLPSEMLDPWISWFNQMTIQQSQAEATSEGRVENYRHNEAEQHTEQYQGEVDPDLRLESENPSGPRFQWQPKQGLLGVDWLPPSRIEEYDTGRHFDPLHESWFSPWLQVLNSHSTQSRVFPLLHAYASKRRFPSKDSPVLSPFPLSSSLHLHLDRSASDSILTIPSNTSAFRRYVRSSSLPSLESVASSAQHSTQHLPEIPHKDLMTPREREFQPITVLDEDLPHQQSSDVQQSASEELSPVIQLQDIFGTPTPTEILSCTDKAIQTGEEDCPAPFQKTLFPSLSNPELGMSENLTDEEESNPFSTPSTDSDVSSDDDRPAKPELKEKSWKDMQDVTDEDRFADAIYFYHQYGTMPNIFPSPQEVKEDLGTMELVATADLHYDQANGYVSSCAIPIPRQALHVEQVEEEMFQSTMDPRSVAHSGHRPRRKPSKVKHPRGPVYSNKPCSFYLEGQCYRADCKYSHDMSSITCCFWQVGQCFKGDLCPFLHGYTRQDDRGGGETSAAQSVVELSSEDFPELSGVTQDFQDHSSTFQKKKKVKKSGVRNQNPRGN